MTAAVMFDRRLTPSRLFVIAGLKTHLRTRTTKPQPKPTTDNRFKTAQGEFPLELVPLDDDVLSLELDRAFADCTADGDAGPLFRAAAAVMALQREFGLIPRMQVGPGGCVCVCCVSMRNACVKSAQWQLLLIRNPKPPTGAINRHQPTQQGKGPAAAAVRDICIKMRRESPPPAPASPAAARIGRVILLDRECESLGTLFIRMAG